MNVFEPREDIILGALLHDIGKLYMKGGENGAVVSGLTITNDHPIISAEFIDKHSHVLKQHGFDTNLVKELVQRHHSNRSMSDDCQVKYSTPENRKVCTLISNADNFSSGERIDGIIGKESGSGSSYRTAVSHSVFSAISSDEKLYGYPIGTYHASLDKASSSHRVNELSNSIRFITEFDKKFDEIRADNKSAFINKVNELLGDYTWCFPSASNEIFKDVSLYDHLKTTAAIATAMLSDQSKAYIIEVKITGAEKFIAQSNTSNTITINNFKQNCDKLKEHFNQFIEEAKQRLGITDCSIIYSNMFSAAFMVSSDGLKKLKKLIQTHNDKLIDLSNLNCFIEARYKSFDTKSTQESDLMQSNRIIKSIRKSFDETVLQDDFIGNIGIGDILTNNDAWVSNLHSWVQSKEPDHTKEISLKGAPNTGRVYAIVNLTITNLNDVLDKLFNISKNRINVWAKNRVCQEEDEILEYGSISRVCNIYRNINALLSVNDWLNVINISQEDDSISFIIGFDDLIFKFPKYLESIYNATINTFDVAVTVQTFIGSDDAESVYQQAKMLHSKLLKGKKSMVYYNGQLISLTTLSNLHKYVEVIRKSKELNMSQLYKLAEYISMYKRDIKSSSAVMSIPRYFNNKYKNYNARTIDPSLERFYTGEFTKLLRGERITQVFIVSDTLILDSIR